MTRWKQGTHAYAPIMLAALYVVPAIAASAQERPSISCIKETSKYVWTIRDALDLSGNATKPAILTLNHSAGEDTTGHAKAAVLYDRTRSRDCKSESRFGAGVSYFRNESAKASSEKATAGLSYTYGWQGRNRPDMWRQIGLRAEYGRDLRNDSAVMRGEVRFHLLPARAQSASAAREMDAAARQPSNVPPGLLAARMYRTPPPPSDENRGLEASATDASEQLRFTYEISPGLEYYSGYQPDGVSDTLRGGYASLSAYAEWHPFTAEASRDIYFKSEWIGRRRVFGDDAMPESPNSLQLTAGFEIGKAKIEEDRRRRATIELTYDLGRRPENGFVRDETLSLTLTFLLDRIDSSRRAERIMLQRAQRQL